MVNADPTYAAGYKELHKEGESMVNTQTRTLAFD